MNTPGLCPGPVSGVLGVQQPLALEVVEAHLDPSLGIDMASLEARLPGKALPHLPVPLLSSIPWVGVEDAPSLPQPSPPPTGPSIGQSLGWSKPVPAF